MLIHQSESCQSNAVVVHGRAGVLLIDPGVYDYEMAALANDLSDSGQTVTAGFSTHPHWVVEHQAHAPGHAVLLIEERGILIVGDILSDVLIAMLDLNDTADPIGHVRRPVPQRGGEPGAARRRRRSGAAAGGSYQRRH